METVATFTELTPAQLMKRALEDAGIPAFIPDELTATTAPPYLWASGGIRLQVPPEHVESATRLIAQLEASPPEGPDPI